MSTIQEHKAKIRRLIVDLPQLGRALMTSYAETAVSLRKENSIETGINKNGNDGQKVQYSTKKVPSYWLKGKELNQAGRTYLKQNKTANWYGLRVSQGLRSPNVNLDYSGKTWKDYGVLEVNVSNGILTAKIGLSEPNSAQIFAYNVTKFGKFYLNTLAELTQLRADVERESRAWLNDYLS